ncbi:hypothetical protein TNCV_1468611 [Trichonephila clavipes]|uniref:Uncharacterized protein n=1 Tax=Trichonephila clavipes TaxID=2585209 RepID=A0A8X6RZ64_TRICX|nr:hypothetical protein TNCV_1468611 [Trichonephila clavipes]
MATVIPQLVDRKTFRDNRWLPVAPKQTLHKRKTVITISRKSTPQQTRLLSLLVTLLLCLEEEFQSKQSTTVLQRLASTPSVQSCVYLDYIQQERPDIVELKTSFGTRMEAYSFQ